MKHSESVKNLLIKGIELNEWILESPHRIDDGLPEWDNIVLELADCEAIIVNRSEEDEFQYLIDEFEEGVSKITDYLDKRVIITKIKASIMQERVNNA